MNAWVIARVLWKRALRQKYRLLFYIIIPVVGILLPFATFSPTKQSKIQVGVIDRDASQLSRSLVTHLEEVSGFEVLEIAEESAEELLIKKRVHSVIEIPKAFQHDFLQQQGTPMMEWATQKGMEQHIVSLAVEGYMNQLTDLWKQSNKDIQAFNEAYQRFGKEQRQMQIKKMQRAKGIGQQTLGLTMVLMSMMTTTLLGGIIEDQKNKTYARILSTATGCRSYIGGQMLWVMCMGCVQIVLVVALSRMSVFQISIDWQMLVVLLGCMLVMCIAIGVGVIACCKTQEHIAIMNMFVILPSAILAGCLLPREMMDEKMLRLGALFPQYYLLNIAEKIQEGTVLTSLGGDLGIFFFTCSIVIIVGIWGLQIRGVEKMG